MGKIFGDSNVSSTSNTDASRRRPPLGYINIALPVKGADGNVAELRIPSITFIQGDAEHEKFVSWIEKNPEKALQYIVANAKFEYRRNSREQKLAMELPSFD